MLEELKRQYGDAADLVERPVAVGRFRLTLLFLDGLTSGADIARFVLEPLLRMTPPATERASSAGREPRVSPQREHSA